MSQENVEIVRRIDDAFTAGVERGDFGAGFEVAAVAEDHELIAPSEYVEQRSYKGREGFVAFLQSWTEDFDRFTVQREELLDAGEDRVFGAFRQTAYGRASGVPVEVEYFQVCELRNGILLRTSLFLDRAAALEAAGLRE